MLLLRTPTIKRHATLISKENEMNGYFHMQSVGLKSTVFSPLFFCFKYQWQVQRNYQKCNSLPRMLFLHYYYYINIGGILDSCVTFCLGLNIWLIKWDDPTSVLWSTKWEPIILYLFIGCVTI